MPMPTVIAKWEWPETAKTRGEPRKMTHSTETEIFSGWSECESCSPGNTGDMPCWQISRFQNKKLTFSPKYPNFRGQNCPFSSLAATLSHIGQCFQHRKGVSLVSGYEDTKSFTPSPKIGFWPQTGLIGPKTGIFGYIWAFLAHLILFPTKKTMQTSCLGGFFVIWVPKLLLTPVKIRIFGPKTAKFGLKLFFWPNIGIFGPFGFVATIKRCKPVA